MAEKVRVVVRCRPFNKREEKLKCQNIVEIKDCNLWLKNAHDAQAPVKSFTYDVIYNELSTTENIYNDVCYGLVDSVLEGYNATIFAYGQTGCGKTHTMQGPDEFSTLSDERGIIARTFEHIFEAISLAKQQRFLVLISYLEIYNENIRDLLAAAENNNNNNNNHILKEVPGVGVVVPTLSSHTVHNANECFALLNAGNKQKAQAATLMNAQSSRSHTIFTVCIEQIQNEQQPESCSGSIRRGKLNLVDLAGSERQQKTGAAGERLREATKINLSLSALGNVISALVDGKTKHIPYRDSKLTRLLQDSLGGNTKTLMIACISPADNNYDETISTLRYASRAKNIANKPCINEDPKDAKLREYQEEIDKLKKLLNESQQQQQQHQQQQPIVQLQQQSDETNEIELISLNDSNNANNNNMTIEDSSKYDIVSSKNERNKLNVDNKIGMQLEARQRIENIKAALIGGERASDKQLYEKRQHRKMAAQRRLSALAQVLSRVHETEDRDLLQIHYTSIQQELNVKNDYLKRYRQKIRALEQEVNDLQAEFQLDRADYLDSIRKLQCNLKFQQQIMECALPILRKAGKYWDLIEILHNSHWNDDLKVWKLPEHMLNNFKLPMTAGNNIQTTSAATASLTTPRRRRRTASGVNYFDEAVLSALKTRSADKILIIQEENEETDEQPPNNEELGVDNRAEESLFKRTNNEHLLRNYFHNQRSKTANLTINSIETNNEPNLVVTREDVLKRWRDFAKRQMRCNREEGLTTT